MAVVQAADSSKARRLWLPWRPRMRLIFLYPRCWHYVFQMLARFDRRLSQRYTGAALRIAVAVALLPFLIVRLIGFVAVVEITIIVFTISIFVVWGEWMLLLLLFPFSLLARLGGALPWTLAARASGRRWTTRVSGLRASADATTHATAHSIGPPAWSPADPAPWIRM